MTLARLYNDGGAIPTTLPANDVSAWAKASTKPTYAASEITNISAAGQALIDDADAAAQRATLGTAAYSEGTWTPTLVSFTIVGSAPAVVGYYKRIGNLLFTQCVISGGTGGNTSVAATMSQSRITGCPAGALPSFVMVLDSDGNYLGSASIDTANQWIPTFSARGLTIFITSTYVGT